MDDASSYPPSARALNQLQPYQYHIGVSKISHKIGKTAMAPPPLPSASSSATTSPSSSPPHDHNHHRPPVYTVNKNDFRLVVQRLTGSPSSEWLPDPPIRPPKPPNSRLQRMKPPPLAPITRTPPPIPSNPQAFSADPLPALPNPPAEGSVSLSPLSSNLNGLLPLPLSPSQFAVLSPTCSMQLRSPPPPLTNTSPKPNTGAADSGFPFSPSSPWNRILLPSSPGFLRLPVTTTKG
ncbi:VQ motif-containing protein 9-like [Nymphaea colorata]|nr:VQ motif-containing protein 9-like [Nymphaea colorata]